MKGSFPDQRGRAPLKPGCSQGCQTRTVGCNRVMFWAHRDHPLGAMVLLLFPGRVEMVILEPRLAAMTPVVVDYGTCEADFFAKCPLHVGRWVARQLLIVWGGRSVWFIDGSVRFVGAQFLLCLLLVGSPPLYRS